VLHTPTDDDNRRRQTPASVTSLPPTLCRRASNNAQLRASRARRHRLPPSPSRRHWMRANMIPDWQPCDKLPIRYSRDFVVGYTYAVDDIRIVVDDVSYCILSLRWRRAFQTWDIPAVQAGISVTYVWLGTGFPGHKPVFDFEWLILVIVTIFIGFICICKIKQVRPSSATAVYPQMPILRVASALDESANAGQLVSARCQLGSFRGAKFLQNVRFSAQDADDPPCKIWRR